MKRSIGAVLSAAMLAASFLCLGMGMDMGTAYAQAPAHKCCPSQAPEEKEGSAPSCCLLLPGALPAAVAVPAPLVHSVLVAVLAVTPAAGPASVRVDGHGPPGASSPGFSVPASPRAPPAA